jgi:uncharacterized iron-regulated membrane protein
MRLTGQPYSGGRTYVWVDPYDGGIARLDDPREETSPADRYWGVNLHLHLGFWGGFWGEGWRLATQVLWVLGSLAPVVLTVTGVLAWWNPRRRSASVDRRALPARDSLNANRYDSQ